MSAKLTEEIIRHIYKCIGVRISHDKSSIASIMQDDYLLDHTINFDDGQKNKIWGLDLKSKDGDVTILLADCQQDSIPEFALFVSVQGAEACYGCYLVYNEFDSENELSSQPMIAFKLKNYDWAECNVQLQASLLLGMEKIKDLQFEMIKSSKLDSYEKLLSFIKFYQNKMDMI